MSSLSPDAVVVAKPGPFSSTLGEDAVILDPQRGIYYGLTAVGSRIWTLLREPRTPREIRQVLVEEYEVDPALCEQDLLVLLGELSGLGLVEIRHASAA